MRNVDVEFRGVVGAARAMIRVSDGVRLGVVVSGLCVRRWRWRRLRDGKERWQMRHVKAGDDWHGWEGT